MAFRERRGKGRGRPPAPAWIDLGRRGRGRRRSDWADGGASSPAALAALGFVGGLALGAAAWSRVLAGNARGLFSARPVRRWAAVSYLETRPSVDTARLLRDYVAWEPQPLLRRRARRVLAAVEAALGD